VEKLKKRQLKREGKMKVKTLLRDLEPYKELDVYFASDWVGVILFNSCTVEKDKEKVIIYPKGVELERKKE
jgi:hydrogenase maturation factor HypE